MMDTYDVIVVGAGPGGLASAKAARQQGARKVLVLERENRAGGILNQCIHDGFGLFQYGQSLTGPEYACRAWQEASDAGVEIRTATMVTQVSRDRLVTAVSRDGLQQYQAGAIVMATGCRERTRGAIAIPGSRPAGVFTAGVVQNLVNIKNIMVGRRVVILGSGDIGLIMARRLTLEGAKVLAVLEIMPEPSGLERNISQCLVDFGIPLYVSHTVSRIIGSKRLTGVEVCPVDESGQPIGGSAWTIPCDTLILSVGLIPENEVVKQAGAVLDERSNGAITDEHLQTSVPGIFVCGNARKVMDIADYVSEQGEIAGKNAAAFARGQVPIEVTQEKTNRMAKGLPLQNSVTCTLCPNGCRIIYREDGTLEGCRCARGEAFALQELAEPVRVLTLTMKTESGRLIPVKTSAPVPKAKLLEIAASLNRTTLQDGQFHCGQIVVENIDGLAVNLIASDDQST
jgi:thioredoxin reductase/CxxC motif-containing protein